MSEEEEITTLTQPESIDKKEHLAFKLVVFISLYVLTNYFILSEIYSFFGFEVDYFFTVLLVFLSFSYVLGAALLRYFNNLFSLALNVFGSVWLGTMVIAAFVFIVVELLLFFNLISGEQRLILSFSVIFVLVVFSVLNALRTTVKIIFIKNRKVSKPLTIVQISDLHVGAAHTKSFLGRIVRKVNLQKPDVVVITGDLIDGKHKYADGYFNVLNDIKSPVFMVVGNHERMTGMDVVLDLLKDSKVVILRDECVVFNGINILGVDDVDKSVKFIRDFNKVSFDDKLFTVLLYHRPKKFKQVFKRGVDLMLTGHTHAGQVFPLNLILRFYYKKVQGLKKCGDSYLYVSPGTGWWGPPMRLGSNNEITVFKIDSVD